jgi:peptidoglycan/LPS O-acetylase OafA/YrhL
VYKLGERHQFPFTGPSTPILLRKDFTSILVQSTVPASVSKRVGSTFYRPELDVLRFCAFFLVFCHHVFGSETAVSKFLAEFGSLGMCLFFFLSAYLITELLQREKQGTGTVHLKAFYVRRILRIWPLYFAFLAFSVLLGEVKPSMAISSGLVWSFLLMAGNWYIGIHGLPHSPAGILWSISLEEQFYLIWPVLSRSLGTLAARIVLIFTVLIGSAAVWTLASSGANSVVQVWTNSIVQFQMFAMGAGLSLLLRFRPLHLNGATRIILITSGLALWTFSILSLGIQSPGVAESPTKLMVSYWSVGLGCASLLLGWLGLPSGYSSKVLVYLGKISYGLYVFHLLALFATRAGVEYLESASPFFRDHHSILRPVKDILALGLTILLASASYRFYESYFLRLKERFTFVRSRSV